MIDGKHRALGVCLSLAIWLAPAAWAAEPVDEAARAALPEPVRAAGVLRVATSLQWPPFDFTAEAGAPDGLDIRLMQLLAAKLGLRAEITDVKFPAIVPGVSSGRFDAGVDQINITAERAKAVDFVPYSVDGMGLLVRHGTTGIDINHLCGKTLVITQGSAQVGIAEGLSAKCTAAGEAAIPLLYFPNSADTYLALANGRGDGFLSGRAVGAYIAHGNDKLALADGMLAGVRSVSGIVVAKGATALAAALRMALEQAVADGSYKAVLDQFGLAEEALTVEQIQHPPG